MMKRRPLISIDRDAQIVALWQGRPRDQRRRVDIDAFYQWLVDYAPWLVRTDAVSLDQIRALIQPYTIEVDGTSQ